VERAAASADARGGGDWFKFLSMRRPPPRQAGISVCASHACWRRLREISKCYQVIELLGGTKRGAVAHEALQLSKPTRRRIQLNTGGVLRRAEGA